MTTNAVAKTEEAKLEYVPFGAADKIKLTVSIVQNLIAVPTKSGKTCSTRDALRFAMLCQAQRLNPFAGDAYLVGYDKRDKDGNYTAQFSLITAHLALLKRAETCSDFEGMESGVILADDGKVTEREGDFALPDETVVGGWARVYRKGRKPTYRRLATEQRKPAYETPFWAGAKATEQIVKCAEACALRDTFPTLLGGLRTESEMVEVQAAAPAVDVPTPKLAQIVTEPEQVEAESEREPVLPAKATPQAELESFVGGEGYSFAQFIQWAEGSGNLPDASSTPDFASLPSDFCKRVLRAKSGLLKGLADTKQEAA